MKIIIPIQSLSDIITNSSSELFCIIYDTDAKKYQPIIDSWFECFDYGTWVKIQDDREIEEYLGLEDDDRLPFKGKCLVISLEQHQTCCREFLHEGMIAMLDKHIGKDNYKIIFHEGF